MVGIDTAERIAQPRYYGNSATAMRAALDEIAARGCRFLVAGRVDGAGRFVTVAEAPIPPEYRALFSAIPEAAVPQRHLVHPAAARLGRPRSAARHRYQLATVRYGFHRAPRCSRSRRGGNARFLKAR